MEYSVHIKKFRDADTYADTDADRWNTSLMQGDTGIMQGECLTNVSTHEPYPNIYFFSY